VITWTPTPAVLALALIRSASPRFASIAKTVSPGLISAHSMATLPLPAPTSQSTPRSGRQSLPKMTDLVSALVIMPVRCA